MNILDELSWRGLVHQISDAEGLRKYLDTPGQTMYCGFDPTAESLHIGNLVPLLSLVRMLRAGHKPLFLLGGATGLIGDPSGKDKERELSNQDAVQARAERIKAQIEAFVERNTGQKPSVVNNYDWVKNMSAIELLRDVGKYYTVNWMLGKDSVKGRIERDEVGISYTEFSYMILQGYDFYHLCKEYGCRCRSAAATSGATSRPEPSSSAKKRRARPMPSPSRSSPQPRARSSARAKKAPSS